MFVTGVQTCALPISVQHLERPGEIELGKPGVEQHSYLAHGGASSVRRPSAMVAGIALGTNDIDPLFLARMARTILVAFEGAQSLDIFGPAEVFAEAARLRGGRRDRGEVLLALSGQGPLRTTAGVELSAVPLRRVRPRRTDTVLVAGGDEEAIRTALGDEHLRSWLRAAARTVRRIGSVCSGAFLLAGAGLLDGKRAATHWSACARLQRFRSSVRVDADAIFVRDGKVWTSAGVTTGIDMALAMVEEDDGRRAADEIAARLVLYARRPGFQSQFSEVLVAQAESSNPFAPLLERVRQDPRAAVDVADLARQGGMSLRSLYRRCKEHFDTTPARLLERVRVERARTLLATTSLPGKTIAAHAGFGTQARMAAAFERALGMKPRDYRLVSGATENRPARDPIAPPRRSGRSLRT